MINTNIIIFVTPILGSVLLGLIVYTKSPGNLSSKIFTIVCSVISLWTIANYFSLNPIWFSALSWIRLVMFLAVFLQFMFFSFAHIFPQNKILLPAPIFGTLAALAFLTMTISAGPFVFSGTETRNGDIVPLPGPLMPLFAITIFLFWGLAAYYTVKNYIIAKGIEKVRWRYILLGFFVMFLLLISSQFLAVVIFQKTEFVKFGPVFTLPFIVLAAYAIVKHHLLNIKVIGVELLTALIVAVLIIQLLYSTGVAEAVLNGIMLVAMLILGIYLIKSILKEIKDKEKMEILAKKLETANEELRQLDKSKSEFLSIASHQLRTPLSAIRGYVSMVLGGSYGEISETLRRPLNNVSVSSERLVSLINNLLDLSRIESKRVDMNFEKSSVEELVSSVIQELNIGAINKGIELKLETLKKPLSHLLLDKQKIRQAILNIIDNGIKYTKSGLILVRMEESDGKIRVIVKDTGKGMDKEEISNLFQSFYRGNTAIKSKTQGTGLGLYVARKFVELHKGKIWAESAGKGQGSIFYIELPIKNENS